jgi:ribosome recycling factor
MNKFNSFKNDLQQVVDWLKAEFKTISAGVATPSILDSVNVESYGSYMPFMHAASVTVEDPKTLKIVAFDKSQLKNIETAIRDADLGLSILVDSEAVRAIFPQLTSETRAKFVKIAKEKLEDARIKVRQARQEVMDEIDAAKKEGEISEDDQHKKREAVQLQVTATNQELETLFEHKEKAIITV